MNDYDLPPAELDSLLRFRRLAARSVQFALIGLVVGGLLALFWR